MTDHVPSATTLSLAPFRALRYQVGSDELGALLSPPYDVISASDRAELLRQDSRNVVGLILPEAGDDGDAYATAAKSLASYVASGVLAVDDDPALFVYELSGPDGEATRGLVGAVELADPDAGVILPHENTMAGPVSDRLSLMRATEANLEPIYLVYSGGGAASELVASVSALPPLVQTTTPDGVTHRLWAITDPEWHRRVAEDLAGRSALIADGHHRYATYRQLQAEHQGRPGPWDRGLTLLVDTNSYGPQVHPIHRVVALSPAELLRRTEGRARVGEPQQLAAAIAEAERHAGFAVVVVDGAIGYLVTDVDAGLLAAGLGDDDGTPLGQLDVTVLHRVLVPEVWNLADTEDNVGYAHSLPDALEQAQHSGGTAVVLRATPVASVAAVAAAGSRMPRKSTLFTPKPASGLLLRRFGDQ